MSHIGGENRMLSFYIILGKSSRLDLGVELGPKSISLYGTRADRGAEFVSHCHLLSKRISTCLDIKNQAPS